jgi:predicted CopG family antitoxin
MSLTKKISVSEHVWVSLYDLKKPGQTYDSLLEEMVNHEKELKFLQEMDKIESEADFEEIIV